MTNSSVFYFPSLITNRKEKINHHKDDVNLNLIDCNLDYLNSFSPDKELSFQPDFLNSAEAKLRSPQIELLYRFFRQMAETNNAYILRNADHLLATNNQENSNIVCVGPSKQRFYTIKFKLTY